MSYYVFIRKNPVRGIPCFYVIAAYGDNEAWVYLTQEYPNALRSEWDSDYFQMITKEGGVIIEQIK